MKSNISKWFKVFRLKIVDCVEDNPEIWENKIGGENEIVEIDEAKLGKRKNNRGCKYNIHNNNCFYLLLTNLL